MLEGLGARAHLFLSPGDREAFFALFRDVLGCTLQELDFGMPYPVGLVTFPDGSAFSTEVREDLPAAPFCRTWIEFRTRDVSGDQAKLRAAGVREFPHPGSPHAYFIAPGGQVFRLLDVDYKGP